MLYVVWLFIFSKKKSVRRADIRVFFSVDFRWYKMFVFVSRPMNIVNFLRMNGDPPKRVVDYLREERHFPKQNHGNR